MRLNGKEPVALLVNIICHGELFLPKNFKKRNGPYTGAILLRQGEPGTSQYIWNRRLQVTGFSLFELRSSDPS